MPFNIHDDFPILKGIERQLIFFPQHQPYGVLTSAHYGTQILLFDLVQHYHTEPDPAYYPRTEPYVAHWIEGVVMSLTGNIDARYVTLYVNAACNTTELKIKMNAQQLWHLGFVTHNTFSPYLQRYIVSDPSTTPLLDRKADIVAVYDPEPLLGVQRNTRLVLEIPSSRIDGADLDDVPIQYSIGLLFKWISDEAAYFESRKRLLKQIMPTLTPRLIPE